MLATTRQKEVSLSGVDIKILGTGNANNAEHYYSLCNIKSIEPVLSIPAPGISDYTLSLKIHIHFTDGQGAVSKLDFDIQDVTNQAGWTSNLAGLKQAAADISGWRATACQSVALVGGPITVDLNAVDDEVLVYGSPDGGVTRFPIVTDAAGNISFEDMYRFMPAEGTTTAGVFDVGMLAMATAEDAEVYAPALNSGEAMMLVSNKDTGRLLVEPDGSAAHDGPDQNRPVKVGGRARTSDVAAVSNDDRTDSIYDKVGKHIVLPYALPENFVSGATASIVNTTATDIIAAPGANNFIYVTHIIVTNGHATVGTYVNITEETSGTILYTGFAAANGGGFSVTLPVPVKMPTANKKLQATCVTTGSDVRVSASGYKGV